MKIAPDGIRRDYRNFVRAHDLESIGNELNRVEFVLIQWSLRYFQFAL